MKGKTAEADAAAHPRSRGENCGCCGGSELLSGSSPLTRGKLTDRRDGPGEYRLIPAHAGKTDWAAAFASSAAWLIPAHAGKTLSDLRFYQADRSDLGKP